MISDNAMVSHFLILLATAFVLILATALIISFCKRKQNRTRHGLTGMCHQSAAPCAAAALHRCKTSLPESNIPPLLFLNPPEHIPTVASAAPFIYIYRNYSIKN